MKRKLAVIVLVMMLLAGGFYTLVTLYGGRADVRGRVVLCIPVYGQSLALGEEAVRVTDFDSLSALGGGRIVTERMDHRFGFFCPEREKQLVKKLLKWHSRSFELSVYGMAELLVQHLGADTLVCIFPGGLGTTDLAGLGSSSSAYRRLMDDIGYACDYVERHGGRFLVPAICWMQGESDIANYPGTDYMQLLGKVVEDFNRDIMAITQQKDSVRMVCYQTNALSRGHLFDPQSFHCEEMEVPQTMVSMLRDNNLFWASGPTYLYDFAREAIHIDGFGQKRLGYLEGKAVLGILRGEARFRGLIPLSVEGSADSSSVVVKMNVPCPPLRFDTTMVSKASCYGFSVVDSLGEDLAVGVRLMGDSVVIRCSRNPVGCKVRYAVNGEMAKSGNRHGPRGNLRDSQGETLSVEIKGRAFPLHNWCYQFEEQVP